MNILILNFIGFLLCLPRKCFSSLRSHRCRLQLCQLLHVWSGLAKGISSGQFIKCIFSFYFYCTSHLPHCVLITFLLSILRKNPSQQPRSAGLESWPSRQGVEIREAIFVPSNDSSSTTPLHFGVSMRKCKASVLACCSIHNSEKQKAVRIHLSVSQAHVELEVHLKMRQVFLCSRPTCKGIKIHV